MGKSTLHVLVEISEIFASEADPSLDVVLAKAFEKIGLYSGADRVWLMHVRRDKGWATDQWITPDAVEIPAIDHTAPVEDISWFINTLSTNRLVHIHDSSEFHKQGSGLLPLCDDHGVKSLMAVPVIYGGYVVAAFILDTVRVIHQFDTELPEILQIISQYIAPALQRQKLEQSKKEVDLRFQTVLDNLQEGVSIGDLDDRLVYVNQRYTEMLGYTAEELLGKAAYAFVVPAEEQNRILEGTSRRINGAADSYEITQVRKDGALLKTFITACPYRNIHGEVIGNIATHADITFKKKAESDHQNLQQQLMQVQKMEAVGQLAAGLAHDLNNSLTAVIGHLDVVKLKETNNDAVIKSADAALYGCQQASELIRQLLTFSSQTSLNPTLVNLKSVVQEALELSKGLLGSKVVVKMSGQPLEYPVIIDKAQFSQVLTNLIINASHAMPNGGTIGFNFSVTNVDHVIHLNPHAGAGKFVVVTISDSGIGIKDEHLARIFEPFFTTKSETGGTGLGLSTAYATLQKHGGWIEVDSQVGSGTAFSLYLPLVNAVELQPLNSQVVVSKENQVPLATVLVIDDEPVLADLACSFLERAGFKAHSFSNPFDAFAWFDAHHACVSLVLLDMKMPGCDGSEAFERLRKIKPDAQIVLISGFVDEMEVSRLLNKGAVSFIQKPIKYSELVDWISKTIKISRPSSDNPESLFH